MSKWRDPFLWWFVISLETSLSTALVHLRGTLGVAGLFRVPLGVDDAACTKQLGTRLYLGWFVTPKWIQMVDWLCSILGYCKVLWVPCWWISSCDYMTFPKLWHHMAPWSSGNFHFPRVTLLFAIPTGYDLDAALDIEDIEVPLETYPLVNVCITVENHHFQWVYQLFPWAIFHRAKLPEGKGSSGWLCASQTLGRQNLSRPAAVTSVLKWRRQWTIAMIKLYSEAVN